MAISRKELHDIIDQIPEDCLPDIGILFTRIYEEEQEELSVEEASEIDAAKKRIMDGEYASFEDIFGDLD